MIDNSAYDVTDGVADAALRHLAHADKAIVLQLMARISERSYRRGFQQGVTLGPRSTRKLLNEDLHGWRYGTSTDLSPAGDQPLWVRRSIDLLHQENKDLYRVGLG